MEIEAYYFDSSPKNFETDLLNLIYKKSIKWVEIKKGKPYELSEQDFSNLPLQVKIELLGLTAYNENHDISILINHYEKIKND